MDPKTWKCFKTGDCCRLPGGVPVSREEKAELIKARPDLAANAKWIEQEGKFGIILQNQPACPFLINSQCTVYEVRPFVCRRWNCYRECATEPLDLAAKMKDRAIRRDYENRLRKALRWAWSHGWPQGVR